jgi:hypothetical protein
MLRKSINSEHNKRPVSTNNQKNLIFASYLTQNICYFKILL